MTALPQHTKRALSGMVAKIIPQNRRILCNQQEKKDLKNIVRTTIEKGFFFVAKGREKGSSSLMCDILVECFCRSSSSRNRRISPLIWGQVVAVAERVVWCRSRHTNYLAPKHTESMGKQDRYRMTPAVTSPGWPSNASTRSKQTENCSGESCA